MFRRLKPAVWPVGGTLIVTLIANPLFSSLVVRFPVRRFVPVTYQFFAANLLVFFVVMRATGGMAAGSSPWIGVVFYIWTSVFNLFITSVFWCFMADVFRSEQAKRLFTAPVRHSDRRHFLGERVGVIRQAG